MRLFHTILLTAVALLAETPDTPSGFAERDPRYRLQAEDKVEVQYRYTPEYNSTAAVQPDGYISLPLVGEVKVAGLDLTQASAAIREKAASRLNDPDVLVLLKDYVKPYFVVAGEVVRPGRVDLHGNVGLIEAIALSGGFKDSAHRTQVILLRKVSAEQAQISIVDVRKLMTPQGVREDVQLRSGDMLVVPRNAMSKIAPYMRLTESGLYGLALRML